MRRGTTPTICFYIPYKAVEVDHGVVTFKQSSCQGTPLEKDFIVPDDVDLQDGVIGVYLTQADTLDFVGDAFVMAQVRLALTAGVVVASNIVKVPVEAILKEGEI